MSGVTLPINFKEKYKKLFFEAKKNLGLYNIEANVNSIEYAVVHWRRGDQNLRCSTNEDNSINCESAEALVSKIKQILSDGKYEHKRTYEEPSTMFHRESDPPRINPKNPPSVIYISTNEKNLSVLHLFQKNGFKTYKDLNFPHDLSPLDRFIVDLQLMIDSKYYLAW